ncbi:MAG: methyltransferase domain-containing protein [Anaerolineales bacterium]|nr:methyltransferase domain-containing protein [Anaerolineales bacterium]MCX7608769.1 methyltransferase domain-containing protein [Anaerolineales bacterium]MDW8226695.1 methyltransferase domain-containing protein [Anaerolineales bacterium]
MNTSIAPVSRPKEQARLSYNRLSRWYDWLAGPSEQAFRRRGLTLLAPRPGEQILEIGPGTGHSLLTLAQGVGESGHVWGVDISDGMLALARQRLERAGLNLRVTLVQGDAARLDFLPEASLDAIFLSFTLELFDTPEILQVLTECRRTLKPDGRLVVVSLARCDPPSLAIRLYEWLHRLMPAYVDCRPIYARLALEETGFAILVHERSSMWGLPVDILLGRKTS